MAWLSRNNVLPTDSLTADMLNSLANDIRFWGGDVNGGGYKLTNVVLSGSGGFERIPSPVVIAPVAAGGSSEMQLTDYVSGSPDTFPPRWKMVKAADPTPDFAIERYNNFGSLIDKPFSIRMADGIVVMKAQQWTGPVNGEGQTLSNVIIGSGSSVPWGSVTGAPATFPPTAHTHAAADTTSGVFAVARLGSGTPDNTKYLRGDGSWSTVATQTPWTQDVDAAGFSLRNASFVLTSNVVGQLAGYNLYYDGGWKKQGDGAGLAMLGLVGGGGSALYASPTVTGATVPVPTQAIIFRDNNLVEIPRTVQIKGTTFFPDDSTKYLRGDGVWSVPPGAGGGQPQTPWVQNIDGAGYNLTGAKNIYALDFRATGADLSGLSGSGVEIAYDTTNQLGIVQAYDRTASGYKQLVIAGTPVSFRYGGNEVMRSTSIGIEMTGYQLHTFYIMQRGGFGHSWNLDASSGNWRHVENGYGNVISGSLDGFLRIYTSQNGSAGALATVEAIALFGPDTIHTLAQTLVRRGSSAGGWATSQYQSTGGVARWNVGMSDAGDYFWWRYNDSGSYAGNPLHISRSTGNVTVQNVLACANANGERIRVYDSAGAAGPNHAIGVEPNTMWFQTSVNSVFRWYLGVAPDNGASAVLELNGTYLWSKTVALKTSGVISYGAYSMNAEYSNGWKYLQSSAAPAFAIYPDGGTGVVRAMAAGNGTAGAAIPFVEIYQLHSTFFKIMTQLFLSYVPTSASGLASGGVWRDAAAGNVLKIVP